MVGYRSSVIEYHPDLILTGVQAHNDLDGAAGPLLAGHLGLPYVGYIAGVSLTEHCSDDNGKVIVRKEYPGGLVAEMSVRLPAVLGIQAYEQPPRYIAFSKIRQAMKTASIDEATIENIDVSGGAKVDRMAQSQSGERAVILTGDLAEVTDQIVEILAKSGAI